MTITPPDSPDAQMIRERAAQDGLTLTGATRAEPEDGAPEGARVILLLGYGGPALWRAFRNAPEAGDGAPDPLDRWSRRIITAIASEFGGAALFPFDGPPWRPFPRWAARAEPLHQSRLGMFIHEERGLWSGWRGALALPFEVTPPEVKRGAPPCAPCPMPCRAACPVSAFSDAGYDAERCRAHLSAPAGAPCRAAGCLARRACPVGADYAHAPEQAAFHLKAFGRY